jgi:hypothetical protein
MKVLYVGPDGLKAAPSNVVRSITGTRLRLECGPFRHPPLAQTKSEEPFPELSVNSTGRRKISTFVVPRLLLHDD